MNNKRRKIKKKNLTIFLLALVIISLVVLFNQSGKNFDNVVSFDDANEDYKCPDCNVIFIIIDALRPDHLGCYGYERNTSPNIDRLAKEGVYFSNCSATSSSTAYASVGLLTGKYLMISGGDEAGGILDKRFLTLGEYFKEFGYFNAAFLNNAHYALSTGFERGFDIHKNYIGDAAQTTDEVIGFLNNYSNTDPFFIWVHYIDPHAPYLAPEEFFRVFKEDNLWKRNDKKLKVNPRKDVDPYLSEGYIPKIAFHKDKYYFNYYVARYDGEILYTDFHIGRLLKELPGDTIIILTADHGESLGEHNVYCDHGENIYDEVLSIPLIIKDSKYFKGGKKIPEVVSSIDIVPTILSIINPIWYFSNENKFDGKDIKGIMRDKDIKREYIYSYFPEAWSIREVNKNIKYILHQNGKEELYFLPDEHNNLIEDDSLEISSIRDKMRDNLRNWLKNYPIRSDINPEKESLDELTKENLRSLGYLQ